MRWTKYGQKSLLFLFASGIALALMPSTYMAAGGETLYNGIVLPDKWPPSEKSDPRELPPYLALPPEVIPIDVGRQLFVDDFLVENTSLKRTFHTAEDYAGNPVLKPEKPWETEITVPLGRGDVGGSIPRSVPFSDGVWYDSEERLFKMWYMAGSYPRETCYATSVDGIHWDKPELDVVSGTNIVMPTDGDRRDSCSVWLDLNENDPQKRYKMWHVMHYEPGMGNSRFSLFSSGDGIHWQKVAKSENRLRGERTTVFYNPFRDVWVYSIRNNGGGRHRDYQEDTDPIRGTREIEVHATPWVHADDLDPRPLGMDCQLYTLDCVAYESLIVGLFSIYRGNPSNSRPKWTDVCLGYTRDGFHWTRPDRRAFCSVSQDGSDWNYGYIQSAGGGCLVVGDKLYFYMSGASERAPSTDSVVGPGSTGLMTLRRDGFASMEAGSEPGQLTTRPVQFSGKYMFVNANCDDGELRVEILDSQNKVIAPFSRDNCIPIKVDKALQSVQWHRISDLSQLSGKAVKFCFHLTNGRLYSFWVSPTRSGASHGYVAAGGPGFSGHRDTVGADAR